MFTGIIESIGEITNLTKEGENLNISVISGITSELKIDQSVSHNGICLTVVEINDQIYKVTAIKETLDKTNLKKLMVGSKVNLERAMKLGDRLDGHMVQGHIDEVGVCKKIEDCDGSWSYTFSYQSEQGNTTVEKGSITINGVSLTVVDSKISEFSVAIIPYTHEHTNFNTLKIGDEVNLEFDIIGKYLKKFMQPYV
ncbi:riboflavin synthase [Ulvibacter antarcticus]|uniref:Riboflavin synthase n=1 Tax=Ulvibacter antarcticus TaxID=442714 RepID=A0A3L9Z215_9FLAO|nr:riboflavin synthase [Ulvibacter antarcticus]RMA66047.1 riboflavin synthase alpha chain [Ulvibacter antarcticus]